MADMPPMKECAPRRANWITAAPPPMMTKSPTVTWPASMTLLEKMTLLPTLQSWPTCELARNAQRSPTTVCMPPPSVPGFMRHALADQAVAADRQRRGLALVLEVLRLMADRGERERCACARRWSCGRRPRRGSTARPRRRAPRRGRPRSRGRCERPIRPALHPRRWPSGGRYLLASSGSRIMALISASATIWPLTLASP